MPTYAYRCIPCQVDAERNVPIKDRDEQSCDICGTKFQRSFLFTGLTWSPTRNGGHS